MRLRSRSSYLFMIAAADAAYLAVARPHPVRLAHELRAPHAWLARVGPDAATGTLASAAVWCLAAWLALALFAAAGSRLPGAAGEAARALCQGMVPRVLYRMLIGGAGLGVLIAPVAASASGLAPLPAPTWPTSAPSPAHASVWPPPVRDARSLPSLSAPVLPTLASAPPATSHVVRPGESLWQIAAERLGPGATAADIDASWRSIYTANRGVIGPDPDLIQPGERLLLPPIRNPETRG